MAGVGPPPKNASKRARRNADDKQMRLIQPVSAPQPELPDFTQPGVDADGEPADVPFVWPEQTKQWWRMLADHPLRHEFFETDWHYLLETALLHAAFWQGKLGLAAEIRLREAKYGFTPEDRARLRISVAQAAESEANAASKVLSARERMRGVRPMKEGPRALDAGA